MTLDAARGMVAALQFAIAQAESEGRDELNESDLSAFAAEDDAARAVLAAAITNAKD